jgi:glyoxylase-like metal-dependent hydrolase (beta-lactamase superfamily II)
MEKVYQLPLGALSTNCYIIPAENGKAVVIDPASSSEVLMFLQSKELELGAIVITHGHFDHFSGVPELVRRTGAEIIAPETDLQMFKSAVKSWADFTPNVTFEPITPDRTFTDGESFTACGITFKVMSAPGHTAGSCLLFCETLGDVIFCGDVVFRGAVGRTDGFSGSGLQMRESLRKIAALDGDYTIYCGHGENTTLETERLYNPYFS